MDKEEIVNERMVTGFPVCMSAIISELEAAGKYAAVHTYSCTLRSFTEFSGDTSGLLPVCELFTPGRLKAYQEWLLSKSLSWNSISTYMRTLRAVFNRIFPVGSSGYIPGLFNDVYTKVESRTKRSLTQKQMRLLLESDIGLLPEDTGRSLAYFLLMFLFRGMPFIDLAHLRKRDVQGNVIVYCRHKTGRQMTVRIPKEALPLMKKFSDRRPGSIYQFPILDSSLGNGVALHRCYLDALRSFNGRLVKVASLLLPGVKLSSYTARHTWATLSYHLGTPVGIISEALGHSSVRVTETYLKPFAGERIDRANYKLITSVVRRDLAKSMICNTLYTSD